MNSPRGIPVFLLPFLAGASFGILFNAAWFPDLVAKPPRTGDSAGTSENRKSASERGGLKSDSINEGVLPQSCVPHSSEEVREAFDKIRTLRLQGGLRDLALANLLVAGMASRDPESMLKLLLEPESKLLWRSCIPTLLNVWIASDPVKALDVIRGIEMAPVREELEFRLLHALAEQEPQGAFEVLQHNGGTIPAVDAYNLTGLYFQTFLNWAVKDLDGALSRIGEISDPLKQSQALHGIATAYGRKDFQGALDWCSSSVLDESTRLEVLGDIFREGFRGDGLAAMQELKAYMEESGGKNGLILFQKNFQALIELDPKGASSLLMQQSAKSGFRPAVEEFMKSLARGNPNEAINIIGECIEDPVKRSLIGVESVKSIQTAYVFALVTADENKALDWLSNTKAHLDPELERRVMDKLMIDSPTKVASIYLERDLEKKDPTDLKEMIVRWANNDPAGASEWVGKHVAEQEWQSKIQSTLDVVSARTHPELYADCVIDRGDTVENRELAQTVADRLSAKSPAEAARWADRIEDPELFKTVVNTVSQEWLKQDSSEASKWIARLPVGATRDQAIKNLIESIKDSDPASAEEWRHTLEHQ